MGYSPFEWGEQLNPDKLNEKLKQVHSLLSKAYNYNNLLKRRLEIVNTAFESVTELLDTYEDGSVNWDVPQEYLAYNRSTNTTETERELYIGGQAFFDQGTFTGLSLDAANTTVITDGINLTLDLLNGQSAISRIPLTQNQYGELEPSNGTSFESSDFDIRNLWLTLSPAGIWAEKTNNSTGEFLVNLPDTLTPFLNRFKVSALPGTSFKLFYNTGLEITNGWTRGSHFFYIDKNLFNGNLQVQLQGQDLGGGFYGFGLNQIQAHYLPFMDSGVLKTTITLPAAAGTLTDVLSGDLGDSIRLRITEDDYASEDGAISIYDSDIDGFPLNASSIAFTDAVLYLQIDITKVDGTSPTLPYLKIKYQPSI